MSSRKSAGNQDSAGRKDLFSPLAQGGRHQGLTPGEYISPSLRRNVELTTPGSAGSNLLSFAGINDDEAEKRERRRSKVLDLQRRHANIGSPAAAAGDGPDKSGKGTSDLGLSNTQLTEHYKNCIKLSTENKINSKNAFGLHLIDYMSDMLKKKEITNFQVASSTLDASAKIYAGRVDAIHSETYKVLTGLGRGADKHDANKNDGEQDDEQGEAGAPTAVKKRKRRHRGKTIETNLAKLDVKKFDMEFEVDPLFSKTSAAFDEGGTGGLLLNHLKCLDNSNELVLDSATIVTGPENDRRDSMGTTSRLIDIKDLHDRYVGINLDPLQICPEFHTFEFTNWDQELEESFSLAKLGSSSHAFDLEAEAEPIPNLEDGADMDTGADAMGLDDDFNVEDADDQEQALESGTVLLGKSATALGMDGNDEEAIIVESAIRNIQSGTLDVAQVKSMIKQGTIGTLMQVLASEPSDYSYFNVNLLRTWAGPEHWKVKPKSKDPAANKDKKKKNKKEPFFIKYNEEVDFEAYFKEKKASTTLTKHTLDKWSKTNSTLPEDLGYEADHLFKLFLNPKLMIKRQKQGNQSEDIDDDIANYDYDNQNDRENFCPGVEEVRDDDDDNDTAGEIDFNMTAGDDVPPSQQSYISADGTILTGENLVNQPRKIAKIDIGYAKTAKKMDMKKLKHEMWELLRVPEASFSKENKEDTINKDGEADTANESQVKKDVVDGPHSFQELVKEMPTHLSKTMASNFSVPLAFICLLHLANEKSLALQGKEDMSDFTITQN